MSKKGDKKLKKEIQTKVIELLRSKPDQGFTYRQVASMLGFHKPFKQKLIFNMLEKLLFKKIIGKEGDRYIITHTLTVTQGEIEFTAAGSAYILMEEADDVFIDKKFTGKALHGDIVEFVITRKSRSGKLEGKVINVLKRARTEFVGTIEVSPKFAFVIPDNKKIHIDFFIDKTKISGAQTGDKVLVEINDWPDNAGSPYARVIKVLGKTGETDTEINAIMEDFQLPYEFPTQVLSAADEIPTEISPSEIKKRRDFREIPTITIDPFDAKDFDDALSFQKLENGNYEIGVHIADVSHYVTPNSIIDKEAINRATSVYLVDRVVPMLPEVLSNQVCSLRPNEEKYCFSVVFEITPGAKIKNKWFGRTIINSDRRFTYEEAQERIETKEGDCQEEINILNDLAQIFRAERMKKGALNVRSKEVKFRIDEKGKPIGVMIKTSKEANQLIEEFMLLANKFVASFIGERKQGEITHPSVYRVHDEPSEEKIADLRFFLADAGYTVKDTKNKPISYALNQVMDEADKKGELDFIAPMIIRSMAKAEYSPNNIGHYGLAFEYYSHFTSPIRRYPDLEVHRILQNFLDNKKPLYTDKELTDSCKHYSAQEKKATEAERASIKFMQVVYMSDKIGQEFDGVISGITKYGIFVEDIESKSEGLIKLKDIFQDHFYYDDRANQMVGKNYGDVLKMGTKVKIKVLGVDMINRNIEFKLLNYKEG